MTHYLTTEEKLIRILKETKRHYQLAGDLKTSKYVGKVLNSRKAEDELTALIQKAHTHGEACFITII